MNARQRRQLCLALLMLSGHVDAIQLLLSPTILKLNPLRGLTTSTSLKNQDSVPLQITAQVMRWTQQNGHDVLEPTPEVLVNPPRFILLPGHTQLVRIGLRARSSAPESTYRLILTARPDATAPTSAASPDTVSVQPSYAFSLPLFVTSPGATARLQAQLQRAASGFILTLKNTGLAAAALRNVTLQAGATNVPVGGGYVLAGATLSLPVSGLPPGQLTLSYNDFGQEHREALDLPAP